VSICGYDAVGDPDATAAQKEPSQERFEEKEEYRENCTRCDDKSDDDGQ
jgi:hypothetical protein